MHIYISISVVFNFSPCTFPLKCYKTSTIKSFRVSVLCVCVYVFHLNNFFSSNYAYVDGGFILLYTSTLFFFSFIFLLIISISRFQFLICYVLMSECKRMYIVHVKSVADTCVAWHGVARQSIAMASAMTAMHCIHGHTHASDKKCQ